MPDAGDVVWLKFVSILPRSTVSNIVRRNVPQSGVGSAGAPAALARSTKDVGEEAGRGSVNAGCEVKPRAQI